jgi:poly(A) polymerase
MSREPIAETASSTSADRGSGAEQLSLEAPGGAAVSDPRPPSGSGATSGTRRRVNGTGDIRPGRPAAGSETPGRSSAEQRRERAKRPVPPGEGRRRTGRPGLAQSDPAQSDPAQSDPAAAGPRSVSSPPGLASAPTSGGPSVPAGPIPARLAPILEAVGPLAERFSAEGHRLYLVGGVVRDLVVRPERVARPEVDLDLTTDAEPETIERLLDGRAEAIWRQGKAFGTIGARLSGRRVEITTHRAEVYRSDSRKPSVRFSTSLEEDLGRRDFTVNAMALAVPELTLVDPFDGLQDLMGRVLRTPLSPDVSFGDDPLRMLRAARFVADLGLEPTADLTQAIERMAERLRIVSPERIRDELDKLLVTPDPSAGLWFLVRTGLAAVFLPELPALALEQDPVHRHKDVLAHTIAVVAKTQPERLVRLAALFHDIGKPRTRQFGPQGVTFHHHDVEGARLTRERMRALRYPEADIEVVAGLVELHLRFHTYRMGWSDRAVRRYVRDAGPLLGRLNELTRCDCTTRNVAKARALGRRMDELERRIAELAAEEELAAIRPELDGRQVMEILGIPPSPAVGEALRFLLDVRLDEGPLGEEEATRRLRSWWEARQAANGTP